MEEYLDIYTKSGVASSVSGSIYTSSEHGGNTTDLSTPPETSSFELANPIDIQKLWTENAITPQEVRGCVHDVFTQRVQQQPDAPAICAWDGTLTYSQLDQQSSRLASYLIDIGVQNTLVPLCFDKSKWLPIAVLAVMKAGAASVLLDTSVPQERLKSIVDQLSSAAIITTPNGGQELASAITQAHLVSLTETFIEKLSPYQTASQHSVDPSSPLYIVFTSGSTGVPKGVIITHANFCSAIKHQQQELGFKKSSRVFDFVSYAFDVAWSNIVHTLTVGGCLCIPSQQNVRSLQVTDTINQQQVNFLHITPTVARLLEPEDLPTIEKILFIGEPLTRSDAERWVAHCEVYNTYGPAECTVTSTMTIINAGESGLPSIGTAIGAVAWVVDPDSGRLSTPGSIGELWLEGPIVGAGYLNNPEKTNAAFIKDPIWLGQGALNIPGRKGTLYRTGDLVRQDMDGSLSYMGRKDTQVKIRGQRVELSDVEHHVRLLSPTEVNEVVAEVVTPGVDQEPVLTVFLSLSESLSEEALQTRVSTFTPALEKLLAEQLPSYMVPGAYLPIPSVPRTATGKTDRKALREVGARLISLHNSSNLVEESWESLTVTESAMRILWSSILGISASRISKSDSFLRLGGDSIRAIRLIGAARKQGISLAVADVFAYPTLDEISRLVDTRVQGGIDHVVLPFSLLKPDLDPDKARREIADLCSVAYSQVEDILPCTALQEGLLAMTAKNSGDYISEVIVELRPNIDLTQFRKAWDEVGATATTLRTRIADLNGQGLVQVVLSTPMIWHLCSSVDEYRQKIDEHPFTMNSSLSRFGLIEDPSQGKTFFAWTQHHALYDGWSLPLVQEAVEKAYQGDYFEPFTPMSTFMDYLAKVGDQTSFWKDQFSNLTAPQFPALPDATYQPKPDTALEYRIENVQWPESSVTPSAMIRAVLALVVKSLSGSADTVFGVVVSGRQAPVVGIDRMAGPAIATIPVRLQLDGSSTIDNLLEQTQQMALDMIPFEQTGLQRIQKFSEDSYRACQFQTLLVVQSVDPEIDASNLFTTDIAHADASLDQDRPDLASTHALSLICHVEDGVLQLRMVFDKNVVSHQFAERMAQSFENTLRQICLLDRASTKVETISMVSSPDLDTIWGWNGDLPETVDGCIHELISERARVQPDALAINAWDGQLTYGRLEEMSTQLAHRLLEAGIGGTGTIVPLCFDKSAWTSVGILGLMKTGAACVTMDVTQPEERLRSIIEQIGSHHILSGFSTSGLASKIAGTSAFVIDEVSMNQMSASPSNATLDTVLPSVDSKDLLYMVFTSGSTGRPKGAMISHSNFANAVQHAVGRLRFRSTSRVADFASYAFDVSWSNLIFTLVQGGCLCVPSEHERKNDLIGFLNRARVNYMDLTPAIASALDWSVMPKLDTLVVGGELVDLDRMPYYDNPEAILVTYGPAECTVNATVIDVKATKAHLRTIGTSLGFSTWIVDPDTGCLVPVGATGELVLEGPLVGQGYFGDADKTAAAFIKDPEWLLNGTTTIAGRHGRLYKTGDLVKYEDDGTITFIARKDTQVKLRGQRVELSEVEYHIRQVLPEEKVKQVVAEVVTIGESKRQLLVAFLVVHESSEFGNLEMASSPLIIDLNEQLTVRLPTYMVPSAYIPLDSMPIAPTGKIDRRALRSLVTDMGLQAFRTSDEHKPVVQPTTDVEVELQALWAAVLEIEPSKISIDDNFIRLGGDSIAAMRLVAAARKQHMLFTVIDVLKTSQLSQLALLAVTRTEPENDTIQPFSLLRQDMSIDDIRSQVADLCKVDQTQIEDVFPCTALQEGLLAMTAQRTGDYVSRIVTELGPEVSISRFQEAIKEVVSKVSILRTRIVEVPQQGFVQVVLRPSELIWDTADSIEQHQRMQNERECKQSSMCMGAPLTEFAIIEDVHQYFFAWTQHHALYDGWSLALLQNAIEMAYTGGEIPTLPGLQAFVKHIEQQRGVQESTFWQDQFLNLEAPQFPALPAPSYRPKADKRASHSAKIAQWPAKYTSSSLIRAAWATVMASQSDCSDVVFGAVTSGRQAPVKDIESVAGPTIATNPIRIRVPGSTSVEELLNQVQQQALDMVPFEQTGLQNIKRISQEADAACQFQSLLVIQPADDIESSEAIVFKKNIGKDDTADADQGGDSFNTFALAVTCQQVDSGLQIQMSFDSQVISEQSVNRIAHQLEHVINQLCSASQESSTKISDLNMVSDQDLCTVWQWNSHVPETVNTCVHDVFAQIVKDQPDAPSVAAWDGELTYAELDKLSTYLASQLLAAGVGPGVLVPLCFDKSLWIAVAALAVMKSGAASVALDTSQPEERLQGIVEQISPLVILTSEAQQGLAARITGVPLMIVSTSTLDQCQPLYASLPLTDPASPLYMVFTSGSTGQPKGAIVTHRNFSSAIRHQQEELLFNKSSRVLDFTSYAFDVFWSNILHTLTCGGCFCIPSQEERMSDIVSFVNRLQVNYAHFTPTLGRILEPSEMPGLETVVFSGEALKRSDAVRWASPSIQLLDTYGPAECTVTSTMSIVDPNHKDDPPIGHALGTVTWIVRPDGQGLSAVGTIGELWLEGPLIGAGYLNKPEITAKAFVEDPSWLLEGCPRAGIPGRRGRMYKTGDLVRYNDADHSLQYLGRKDTQVKLRGQRIELGEVEHHVQSLIASDEVTEIVAEVITPESTQTPILAIFLTIPGAVDIEERSTALTAALDQTLTKKVPAFMRPSAYIPIAKSPVTATGKTDRKALRELGKQYTPPAIQVPETQAYELTLMEAAIRDLWADLLKIDASIIGPDHHFVDIGGDSIKIMSLTMAIRNQWDVNIKASSLLGSGGVLRDSAALITSLIDGQTITQAENLDLEKEVDLLSTLLKRSSPKTCDNCHKTVPPTSSVFLTGATGYLGTQLLRYLLNQGLQRIIVLVRPINGQSGLDRIIKAAKVAGWWEDSFASSIDVWQGDLAEVKLGLSPAQWETLCGVQTSHGVVDAIVHNGSAVHWSTDYARLKAANVNSTLQLLQASMQSPFLNRFVYISGGQTVDEGNQSEADELTGYDQTKRVSERLVQVASQLSPGQQGKFSTIKPGLIVGDTEAGIANSDDFIWRIVAAAVKLGARPQEDLQSWLPISDVKTLSRMILDQTTGCSCKVTDFMDVTHGMPTESFWSAVQEQLQVELKGLDLDTWIELAKQDIARERESHPLWPVQHFLGKLGIALSQERRSTLEEVRDMEAAIRSNVTYLEQAGLVGSGGYGRFDKTKLVTRTKLH